MQPCKVESYIPKGIIHIDYSMIKTLCCWARGTYIDILGSSGYKGSLYSYCLIGFGYIVCIRMHVQHICAMCLCTCV